MNITKNKIRQKVQTLITKKGIPPSNDDTKPPITQPTTVSLPIPTIQEVSQSQNLMPVINSLMTNILDKNKDELDIEKITPISEECPFGLNGIWLFIGRQGSGKSYKIMQTILYTEILHRDKPLFNNIMFCSTSNENDKTIDAFKDHVRTRIEYVQIENLLTRIEQHIKHKKKFYSIMSYVQSKGKIVNKVMKKLAIKHHLIDTRKTAEYIRHKLERYGHPSYPARCLLIMDDFMGIMDLERKENPMVRLLTKCRHYNITCIISQQSTKGIGKCTRRLSSDACIWAGFGENDFIELAKEMGNSRNPKVLFDIYKQLKGHSFFCFHTHIDRVIYEVID